MNSLNRLAAPSVSASSGLLPHLYAVTPAPLPPVGMQWIAVRQRFEQFHNNLTLTTHQFLDGMTKRNSVVSCLNRHYYSSTSDTDNSFLIGSWGEQTAMRPPRDVDAYFVLPVSVYTPIPELSLEPAIRASPGSKKCAGGNLSRHRHARRRTSRHRPIRELQRRSGPRVPLEQWPVLDLRHKLATGGRTP